MMENDKRTERMISSLDGLQKTAAPDFFYTRLMGRMQRETEPAKKPFFLLRPAFITAALSVVFIINLFSLTQLNKQPLQRPAMHTNDRASIESFAEAYNMNTVSVYE